jgi:hypothetical protein
MLLLPRGIYVPVGRIERIIGGVVNGAAEPSEDDGKYHCHFFGSNSNPEIFDDLDKVADFLRRNKRSGVRMNPGWSKISRNVYVDGVPL